VLFAAVHVFEVMVTGFWNNLRSMITGESFAHLGGGQGGYREDEGYDGYAGI
jgi:hypothetical protein